MKINHKKKRMMKLALNSRKLLDYASTNISNNAMEMAPNSTRASQSFRGKTGNTLDPWRVPINMECCCLLHRPKSFMCSLRRRKWQHIQLFLRNSWTEASGEATILGHKRIDDLVTKTTTTKHTQTPNKTAKHPHY